MTEKKEALITPEFRVSFAHVFTPQDAQEPGKKPKYGISMLFPLGADLSKLKAAAAACAQEAFGERLKDPIFTAKLRSPFRDQGEKSYAGYVKGAIFLNATAEQRPGLVDENVQAIIEQSKFYGGCYAIAEINFFAYGHLPQHKGNWGIGCGVNNIQKTRDGETLGGRPRPEEVFKPAAAPVGATATGTAATALFQ